MVYTGDSGVSAQVPGIARDIGSVRTFVQRLVMRTVFDVLEHQARSALIPDSIILTILGQPTVNITYEPMECPAVAITLKERVQMARGMTPPRCIVVGNTVTGICIGDATGGTCDKPMDMKVVITPVNTNYTSFAGTLSITNIVMANWSRQMWLDVVNRALQMLALGPFGSNFFSASATVGEN
ncbi:hypothetical protein KIN20_026941 [Parelaphostrongylus tenuis]|uniref:Uncharacterized protein n=1 Tax=Parelaphostrongylus tenuis TaxID=148309 RepID=A0AAD5QYN0_PARTN|nr:hypothetical protein KIN20_026941 [Parelaphostrongylus tenuis]